MNPPDRTIDGRRPIVVELHDGRRFEYSLTQLSPAEVIADLQARGVRRADIRRTVHTIPRGTIPRREDPR